MGISGVIIAIGGNEDKGFRRKKQHVPEMELDFTTSGILCRILSELKSDQSPVEIITSASSDSEKAGRKYISAFRKLGHKAMNVLHFKDKLEADQPEIIERINRAECILFSGGDQFKLTSAIKDTELTRIINRRYIDDGLVVAGTSAGAMALPDLMIYPGAEPINVREKKVPLYEGLSLIYNVIIDTHFLVRGRFRRLSVAIANNPKYIGIGLEEDTGIIIREGNQLETIGSGLVTILDAHDVLKQNTKSDQKKHKIFIENLKVHVLSYGNIYTLPEPVKSVISDR